jgi:putative transposase
MNPVKYSKKNFAQYDLPGYAHELTFSCYHNQPFLSEERNCLFLAEAIATAKEKHFFDVWAYVFMPEHVHIIIWPKTIVSENKAHPVADIIQSIKQSSSRKALIYYRKYDLEGLKALATGQKLSPYRFWQDGRGYDRLVGGKEALTKMVDYIHGNPVRREYVKSITDWKWSSAGFWYERKEGMVPIDSNSFPVM